MKIIAQTLPHSRYQYDVTIDSIESAQFYTRALERLAKNIKVTGFRPGKAPAGMVRSQVSPEALREEAYSLAVHDAWHEVGHQLAEQPIEDPAVEIIRFDEGQESQLRFGFDVRPAVKVADWQKIAIKDVKKRTIGTKDVEAVLDSLRQGQAKTILKLEKAGTGDKVDVSFAGYLKNIKQDRLSSKNFPIILGSDSVIPGFAEQLIGLKKGEKKTFTLDFPKDHSDKQIAGQPIRFEVEIEEVYSVVLPPLIDEFAKTFDQPTVVKLREAIHADLEKEATDELFTQQKAKWLAEFEKKVQVDLPESLLTAEIERSKTNWQEFLKERHFSQEEWLGKRNLTLEQLEKDWRQAATATVTIGLGLSQLAKEQKQPLATNEEYQQFLEELVKKSLQG